MLDSSLEGYCFTNEIEGMSEIDGTNEIEGTNITDVTQNIKGKGVWGKLGEAVMDLVYPPSTYCILCNSYIDRNRKYNMCDNCIEKVQWVGVETCHVCGRPLEEEGVYLCPDCIDHERYFDQGFTCAAYGLYERKMIADFKKSGKLHLARVLGHILYDRIVIENLDIDGIIPVPIHKKRLKERGFNQTELMGRFLSQRSGWPLWADGLIRIRQTSAMKKLDKWERRKNMEKVFQVKNPEKIAGKNILVIDDIFTTGATLEECAKALKTVGAQKVYILTIAAGKLSNS